MNRIIILTAILLTACTTTASVLDTEGNPIPNKIKIEVPFSPQAPDANWDAPYQEACEEMSIMMVHHFFEGTELDQEQADAELLELVAWEEANGYPEDVNMEELANIAEKYYKVRTNILYNPTVDDLKVQLAAGNPVIVPAAGRQLGNPYFSGEGPWYHMLVLTGYDRDEFITNDPGTRRGEDYKYKYDVLLRAVHDWTGVKEEIGNGRKIALILTL